MAGRTWGVHEQKQDSVDWRRRFGGVDCRSLPPTQELVALFEQKCSRAQDRQSNPPPPYLRSESYTLRQRERVCSPVFQPDHSPLRSQVRLSNRRSAERAQTQGQARDSSAPRTGSHSAKSVLFSCPKPGVSSVRSHEDTLCNRSPHFSTTTASPITKEDLKVHNPTPPQRITAESPLCSERNSIDSPSHSDYASEDCVTPVPDISRIESPCSRNLQTPLGDTRSPADDHADMSRSSTPNRSTSKSRRTKLFNFSLCGSAKSKDSPASKMSCPYSPLVKKSTVMTGDERMTSGDISGSSGRVDTPPTAPGQGGRQVTPPRKPKRATVIHPVGYTPDDVSEVQRQISTSSVFTAHHARRGTYRSFVSLHNDMSSARDPAALAHCSQGDVPAWKFAARRSVRRHPSREASSANLVPTGATLDEETFQRLMDELEDVKALVGSLVTTLQLETSSSADSPLDEVLRGEILNKFGYINLKDASRPQRQPMFQDTATQTELRYHSNTTTQSSTSQ